MTPARKAALQWFHDRGEVLDPWDKDGGPTTTMICRMLDEGQLTWRHGKGHSLTDKGRRMLHCDAK